MSQNRQLLVPALLALMLFPGVRASGQTLYYATSSASQDNNSVQHVTPGGAANTSIFTATGSDGNTVSRCTAIAVDVSLQKVFLVDTGNRDLWSMNLDGSGLSLVTAGLTNTPTDLALDTVNQNIYYTTSSGTQTNNTIQRMDYTGNNNTVLFTAGANGNNVSRCTALALDLKNSLIFFSDAGVNGIWSLNLSGSSLTLIKSNLTAVPLDLALDVTNQFIYYATSSFGQNSNTVQKLNYAGNANTLLFTATGAGGNGVSRCTAIEFDSADSKLYLADAGAKGLWSLNLDGSGLSQVEANLLPTPRRVRFIPPVAPPTTYTWNNPAGGNWNLAGNWSPDTAVPGPSDTAIISGSGSYTVTVSDKEAVGTLTMSGTSGVQTLNISSGGTLSINSVSTGNAHTITEISGGTLNGIGSLALAGTLDWTGGTISLGVMFGGGSFTSGTLQLSGGTLANSGVLNWSNNAYLLDGGGSVFTNLPGSAIIVSNNASWVYGGYFSGSHVFGNGGTLILDGPGTETMYNENFVNSGTVTVNSGTFSLEGGTAVNSGPLVVASGAALELGGKDTFSAGSSITGAGNLLVGGGTVAFNSGLALGGSWTFQGGTTTITGSDSANLNSITVSGGTVNFNGSGTLDPPTLTVSSGTLAGSQSLVAGTLDWTGGTISLGVMFGGGSFTGGTLQLSGGTLANSGVLNWSNNAYLLDGGGSVFTNLPGSAIIVSNNASWVYGGYFSGSHVFGNGGTLILDGPGTETMYNENFVNSGTVTVNSGTFSLEGGTAVNSGPLVVASGAALELGGKDTFSAGSSITGAGNLLVGGGTVAFNSGLALGGSWTFQGGTTTITGSDSANLNSITVSGGTVNFNGSGTLDPPTLTVSSGTLAGSQSLVAGTLDWTGGTISLGVMFGGGSFTSGTLQLSGGTLANSGVLNWSNNAYLLDGGGSVFTNLPGSAIIVSNNASWVYGGYFSGSHVFGNGGTLILDGPGTETMYNENFVNSGTVTVNSGTFSLEGGTSFLANGTLDFGISNLTSFGSVSFSGPADLGGTLTATFNDPTFVPATNDAWNVMTYGSLVGAFSKISLPPIAVWQAIAGSTSYTIQIKQLGSGNQPVFVQDLAPTNYALVGAPALLSAQVEGGPPFTNQWYSEIGGITNALNNGDRGGRVTVGTTSLNSSNAELSLTISNAQTSDAGPYQVFVTNGFAPYSAASSVGQLVVELEPLFNVNGSLWTLNGGATIQNNVLTLTDGQPGGEARSVFFNVPMYCQAFRVSFTYQSGLGTTSSKADGVTFCLQSTAAGTGAVGIGGGSLGYTGITNSMAIAIDQFTAKGIEYVTNGQDPATLGQYILTTPAVDPSSGDPINVSIVYQTNAISLSLTDAVTLGAFVTNLTVGLLPITGATAFVGFTGGSGDLDSVQTISNFSFIPIPTISAAHSGANILLSWPAAIGGYRLESSTNLGTADWLTLPGPYNAVGQQDQLLITPSGNTFYRLALP